LRAFSPEQRQRIVMRGRGSTSGRGVGSRRRHPAATTSTRAAGRPWIARALVAGGFVGTTNEAFDVWLSPGRPAFVPREGASTVEVLARIHDAGGVASIAHPGLLRHDEWIPDLAADGLDALEAYHSSHDPAATARYCQMARELDLAVSGGSDYHADESHGAIHLGSGSLPREEVQQPVGLRCVRPRRAPRPPRRTGSRIPRTDRAVLPARAGDPARSARRRA
jgi:hypothetical protein